MTQENQRLLIHAAGLCAEGLGVGVMEGLGSCMEMRRRSSDTRPSYSSIGKDWSTHAVEMANTRPAFNGPIQRKSARSKGESYEYEKRVGIAGECCYSAFVVAQLVLFNSFPILQGRVFVGLSLWSVRPSISCVDHIPG